MGRETALPGKPGEVVRVDTPPPLPSEKETFGSEIPSWPGDAVGPIAVPGQENNGPSGGTTTTTPLPEEQGAGLIFNVGKGVPPSIVGPDGRLPAGIGGPGTPIPMPPTSNPDVTASEFALAAFNGQQPIKVENNISGEGSWVAIMPDGTAITYRPAGQASSATAGTTATVEINNASIRKLNSGKHAKFKFPYF
ncbi:hypothetical protein D3C85_938790 [compost metagenome]